MVLNEATGEMIPAQSGGTNYNDIFPDLDGLIARVLMDKLVRIRPSELRDGSVTLVDVELLTQVMDIEDDAVRKHNQQREADRRSSQLGY